MNCESYQNLLSDFVDGSLTPHDCQGIESHLAACGDCAEARDDLRAIVDFCRAHRGEYDPLPNEQAMWLRITNILETEAPVPSRAMGGTGCDANKYMGEPCRRRPKPSRKSSGSETDACHSGARAEPASPEPMNTGRTCFRKDQYSWLPGLPLRGIPE